MRKCLDRKIMFPIMQTEIEKLQIGPETKHKMLFEKIARRGPNAFQGLVEICKGNFVEAATFLQRKSSRYIHDDNDDDDDGTISIRNKKREDEEKKDKRKNRDRQNDAQLPDVRPPPNVDITDKSMSRTDAERQVKLEIFTKEVLPTKLAINVTKSKKYHTHKTLATYDMKSRHRGVFFLVNIINFHKKDPRNGASVDRDNLITLFRGMEFKIFYNEDITSAEFNKLVDELIHSQYLQDTDSLVFAVLTHGEFQKGKQYIEFTDGSLTTVQDILEKFNNINCKNMVGKPKIFLFPMCRGNVSDTGTGNPTLKSKKTETDTINFSEQNNIATSSDIKICYATVPGFETHRDPDTGSWYVQVLCEVFAEHAHEHNLDDMLKMIGEKTSRIRTDKGELQTTSTEENGFHKHLYFNPGYYGDD
ncbi:Caspase Dronc, partial [Pseudolycoriella hygida]